MKKELIHSSKGMTLVELMVAMAIGLVVLAIVYSLYFFGIKSLKVSAEANSTRQQTSVALRRLTQEAREILGPQELEDIKIADKNEFQFYGDVENNGKIELIRYYLDSNKLMRGVILPPVDNPLDYSGAETTRQIADYIRNDSNNPIFRYFYYDKTAKTTVEFTGLPLSTANRDKVTSMTIKLIADKDTSSPPSTIRIEDDVYLRNSKSE